MLPAVARVETNAAIHVAPFRAALRSFLRGSELVARASRVTPQRYLLLLMIKRAPDRSERATSAEGERRLAAAFTQLDVERERLREAFAELEFRGASDW
jgi:hypothetical protein